MNHAERFQAQMHYDKPACAPIWHWGAWEETWTRWYAEGLPESVKLGDEQSLGQFLGTDGYINFVPVNWTLCPEFEEKVLQETNEYRLVCQGDGVVAKCWKNRTSIPQFVDYTLKSYLDWPDYVKRLDPSTPLRYPADWLTQAQKAEANGQVIGMHAGSLFGKLRDWVGLENIVMVVYDEPKLFEAYVEAVVALQVSLIEQVCSRVKVDMACYWEDMCYNGGAMISPKTFRQYMTPGYKKINEALRRHGVDVIAVDCDGCIDKLIPLWLEVGVNCMVPLEVGTWGTDVRAYRKEYGKDLLMIGGVDKRELAKGKADIRAELDRVRPLIEEGGYVPMTDHLIPPDVSLDNYKFYLQCLHEACTLG